MTDRLDYGNIASAGMKSLLGVHAYLKDCGLEDALLELVYLRVSMINACAFCIDMHTHELLKLQFKAEKLLLLAAWKEAGAVFSDREQAALRWAESVTYVAETHVPDEEFKLVSKHFSEKELVDLTLAVSSINAFNRMAISFRKTPASARAAARAASKGTV